MQRSQPAKNKNVMSSIELFAQQLFHDQQEKFKRERKNPLNSYKPPDQFPSQ